MFKITLSESGVLLRRIIDFLNHKDFLQEVNFFCKKDGICIQSMDEYHVSFVNVKIDAKVAVEYKCEGELLLGIKLEDLAKILKCSRSSSSNCVMEYVKDKNVLSVKFTRFGKCESKFQLKLTGRRDEILSIPDIQYNCIQDLSIVKLEGCLNNLSLFGEDVIIENRSEQLYFSSGDGTSEGVTEATFTYDYDDDNTLESKSKVPVKVIVSLKYMLWILKLSSNFSRIKISLSDSGAPLRITMISEYVECDCFVSLKD